MNTVNMNDKQWFRRGFIADWIVVIVLLGLMGLLDSGVVVRPWCGRPYTITDVSINFPNDVDIVPFWAACVFALGVPLLFFTVLQPWFPWKKEQLRTILSDLHCAVLMLAAAFAFTEFFTELGKTYAGRLRPDYIQRLLKAGYTLDQLNSDWSIVCGNKNSSLLDGRKSFPSGHTSTAFAGATVAAIYAAGKLRVFVNTQHRYGVLWKLALCTCPFFGSYFIGISRTKDYHHNFSDVNTGASIGFMTALVCYLVYYASPTSKHSGSPRHHLTGNPMPCQPTSPSQPLYEVPYDTLFNSGSVSDYSYGPYTAHQTPVNTVAHATTVQPSPLV